MRSLRVHKVLVCVCARARVCERLIMSYAMYDLWRLLVSVVCLIACLHVRTRVCISCIYVVCLLTLSALVYSTGDSMQSTVALWRCTALDLLGATTRKLWPGGSVPAEESRTGPLLAYRSEPRLIQDEVVTAIKVATSSVKMSEAALAKAIRTWTVHWMCAVKMILGERLPLVGELIAKIEDSAYLLLCAQADRTCSGPWGALRPQRKYSQQQFCSNKQQAVMEALQCFR